MHCIKYHTFCYILLNKWQNGPVGQSNTFCCSVTQNNKIKSKAITRYHVIDSNKNYSLIQLNPETGRKHQIRKQLLIHGHPILGDKKYRFLGKNSKKNNSLMLHAFKINFTIDGIKHRYIAELPEIFKKTLKEKYLKIY